MAISEVTDQDAFNGLLEDQTATEILKRRKEILLRLSECAFFIGLFSAVGELVIYAIFINLFRKKMTDSGFKERLKTSEKHISECPKRGRDSE